MVLLLLDSFWSNWSYQLDRSLNFVAGLPVEPEEVAQVDGLSAFGAFRRITLPPAAPGTATASLPPFVFSLIAGPTSGATKG